MPKYAPNHPGNLHRRSPVFWLAAWVLVALYVVASCRAFIPGACATLRALDRQSARHTGGPNMHALRPCCVLPPAKDRESNTPPPPGDSGCALCKLVSCAAPLAARVHLPEPPQPEFSAPAAPTSQCTGTHLACTVQDRAPPRSVCHA